MHLGVPFVVQAFPSVRWNHFQLCVGTILHSRVGASLVSCFISGRPGHVTSRVCDVCNPCARSLCWRRHTAVVKGTAFVCSSGEVHSPTLFTPCRGTLHLDRGFACWLGVAGANYQFLALKSFIAGGSLPMKSGYIYRLAIWQWSNSGHQLIRPMILEVFAVMPVMFLATRHCL